MSKSQTMQYIVIAFDFAHAKSFIMRDHKITRFFGGYGMVDDQGNQYLYAPTAKHVLATKNCGVILTKGWDLRKDAWEIEQSFKLQRKFGAWIEVKEIHK